MTIRPRTPPPPGAVLIWKTVPLWGRIASPLHADAPAEPHHATHFTYPLPWHFQSFAEAWACVKGLPAGEYRVGRA